jgi:hypothetical protein
MPRASIRLLPGALGAALLLFVTIGGGTPEGRMREARGAPPSEQAWQAHRPHVSLLIAGNQLGKFKPCGCTSPQLGGLERLAVLIERLRFRAGEGYGAVSLGWSLRGNGEAQEESKADLYRMALQLLSFDALILGTPDLYVPAMTMPFSGGGEVDLPRPPANVPPSPTGYLAMSMDAGPLATFHVRDLEIRALSLVYPEHSGLLRAAGIAEGVMPPAGALQLLRPRPETLWIVGTDAEGDTLTGVKEAMRRLGPSVIVDLAGGGRVRVEDVALADGPLVVGLGDLGKEVGVLDLDPAPDGSGWRASYHVVELAPEFDEMRSELRGAVASLFGHYKRKVRERGYLGAFPNLPDPKDVEYVGSGRCAACHPGIYQDWLNTPHAHALLTLKDASYEWDPECIRCHVVGFERSGEGRWFRARSGFQEPVRTPHLGGVGCESCHGPGAKHVADPLDGSVWEHGGPGRRRPARKDCMVCHDVENSFGFSTDYAEHYLPAVDHRRVPSDRRTVDPDWGR